MWPFAIRLPHQLNKFIIVELLYYYKDLAIAASLWVDPKEARI